MFTACRTVNGKIFRLEDHLERLYNCAAGIFMQPPLSPDELRELLTEVLRRNSEIAGNSSLRIEIIFSGGLEGETMRQSGKGAFLYIVVDKLVELDEELYRNGVALATFVHQRMCPDVKLLNYVGAIVAHQTVVPRNDAFEVLFVSPQDGRRILEGSTFTVFFVDKQGKVLTPPLDGNILDSITRRVILEILRNRSCGPVREIPVYLDELSALSEVFLVSTARGVLPVTRINQSVIGDGKPGPVTRLVMDLFRNYLEAY